MVAVLVEDQGGARWKGLEAVHHGGLLAVLKARAQCHVNQQLDRVAVLRRAARPIDLDGGDFLGGGVGVGDAMAEALQSLSSLPSGREDDGGRLRGV